MTVRWLHGGKDVSQVVPGKGLQVHVRQPAAQLEGSLLVPVPSTHKVDPEVESVLLVQWLLVRVRQLQAVQVGTLSA